MAYDFELHGMHDIQPWSAYDIDTSSGLHDQGDDAEGDLNTLLPGFDPLENGFVDEWGEDWGVSNTISPSAVHSDFSLNSIVTTSAPEELLRSISIAAVPSEDIYGGIELSRSQSSSTSTSTSTSSFPSESHATSSATAPTTPLTTDSLPSDTVYTCDKCGRTFLKRHLLNRHTRLHTKPITCPISGCNHTTAASRDMNRHIEAKHPEVTETKGLQPTFRPVCPFAHCKYAELGFARQDHLRRHLKRRHPE